MRRERINLPKESPFLKTHKRTERAGGGMASDPMSSRMHCNVRQPSLPGSQATATTERNTRICRPLRLSNELAIIRRFVPYFRSALSHPRTLKLDCRTIMSGAPTHTNTVAQVLNGGRITELEPIEKAKRLAAFAAVDKFVGKDCKVGSLRFPRRMRCTVNL